jgi:hypothetical protein
MYKLMTNMYFIKGKQNTQPQISRYTRDVKQYPSSPKTTELQQKFRLFI